MWREVVRAALFNRLKNQAPEPGTPYALGGFVERDAPRPERKQHSGGSIPQGDAMLRRTATVLAVAALLAPSAGRAHEWEEDYTNDTTTRDDWQSDPAAPLDDYPVEVDVDAPPVSIETFQTSLAPYGEWVVVGSYGRVWRPHVHAGWRPYFYGRWEWTSEGWLWVSDEPFGWAAYHYGRWTLDPVAGWVWVPGYQWAPAWVSWRYSGDVVGWAPLGPGVSVYVSSTPYVEAWWTFVPCHRFVAEPVHRVAFEPARTRRYFYSSAPAPARPGVRPAPGRPVMAPAWGGPPPRSIEQRIGRSIRPVRVVAAPEPGAARARPGEVAIFRPGVRAGSPVARPSPGRDRLERPDARVEGAPGRVERPARMEPPRLEGPGRAAPPPGAPAFRDAEPRPQRGVPPAGESPRAWSLDRPEPTRTPPPRAVQPGPERSARPGGFVRGWGGPGQAAQPQRAQPSFSPPRREAPATPPRSGGGEGRPNRR